MVSRCGEYGGAFFSGGVCGPDVFNPGSRDGCEMGWERGERKSECWMILLCEDEWKGSFATCWRAGIL